MQKHGTTRSPESTTDREKILVKKSQSSSDDKMKMSGVGKLGAFVGTPRAFYMEKAAIRSKGT